MNKKEINKIKKEFKEDNYNLTIKNVFRAYGKGDSKDIVFVNSNRFFDFDLEEKELLYANFKKALTGTLDTKLFELDFEKSDLGKNKQTFLYSLKKSDFEENSLKLAQEIMNNYVTNSDLVITIADMTMQFNSRKSKVDSEDEDCPITNVDFVLCTINSVYQKEKNVVLNLEEKKFDLSNNLDFIIDMTKPIEGFMYPTITDGYEDCNKVLYIAPKANIINNVLAKDILCCTVKKTAKEEKELFSQLLRASLGNKVKTNFIKDIYQELFNVGIDNEEGTISSKDIERVLSDKGIPEDKIFQIQKIASEKTGKSFIDFNIENIIPKSTSKSVKIKTLYTDVSVSSSNLNKIKKINKNGKVCLMIELNQQEEVEVEGFCLETE